MTASSSRAFALAYGSSRNLICQVVASLLFALLQANLTCICLASGHSGGFCHGLKQSGIVCCENGGMGVPQIQDDSAGKSIGLIKQLMREMSTLFPDTVLHIGGDETGSTAPCDMADTKSFEVKLIDFVRNGLGKEVMGCVISLIACFVAYIYIYIALSR